MIPDQLRTEVRRFERDRGLAGARLEECGEQVYVVFAGYPIRSSAYSKSRTDVMIMNTVHYPKTPFDMFFTPVDTTLKGGGLPEGASRARHLDAEWLQWSIHPYNNNRWDPSRDDLSGFMQHPARTFVNAD